MGGACCKASEKPELLTSTKKIPERPKSASGARAAERRKSFVAQALRANRPGTVETIGYDEVEKLIPGEPQTRTRLASDERYLLQGKTLGERYWEKGHSVPYIAWNGGVRYAFLHSE